MGSTPFTNERFEYARDHGQNARGQNEKNLQSSIEYPKGVFGTVTVRLVARCGCRTELTEVSGTGMKVCTGSGGIGIYVVPNLPKCPVPVLMSYHTYRSARYRY